MTSIADSPHLVFLISLVALWVSVQLGALFRSKRPLEEDERHDFDIILTATLTLLGLIIGFSFSMVVSRYDQRKNYEEGEANAIGTEYVRAGVLNGTDATTVRELLKSYVDQRVLFYETRDGSELARIDAQTARLQTELWSVVQAAAAKQPTPTIALVVSGMNDVLNSQGYTQAAWWNRFPIPAWGLLMVIAIFCSVLLGYGSRRNETVLFLILPLAVSISFFLIADIGSPREGFIRVVPQNLLSLCQSWQPQ